jgi:hypothetical protein
LPGKCPLTFILNFIQALSHAGANPGTHLTQWALKTEARYKSIIWRIKERSTAKIGEDGTCSKLVIAGNLPSRLWLAIMR